MEATQTICGPFQCCYGPSTAQVIVRNCGTDCSPAKEQTFTAQVTARKTIAASDRPYNLKSANLRWFPLCGAVPPATSEVLYAGQWWTVTEVYDATPFRVRVTIQRATLEGCAVQLASILENRAQLGRESFYFQSGVLYDDVPVALVHAGTLERLEETATRIWEGTHHIFLEHAIAGIPTEQVVGRDTVFQILGKKYRVDKLVDLDRWDRLPAAICTRTKSDAFSAK